METNLHRRDLFKLLTAAAFTTNLQLSAAEPGAPLFFTKEEFALLDTLTDLIIPTDAHSPGASAAGVAAFIDRTVAEAFLPEDKTSWRNGLASIDRLFLKKTKHQQIAILTKLAAKEDKFFMQLKETTAFAYYTSKIGIHDDMGYLGNTIQEHFSGYEAT
jgi:hypothetical protein